MLELIADGIISVVVGLGANVLGSVWVVSVSDGIGSEAFVCVGDALSLIAVGLGEVVTGDVAVALEQVSSRSFRAASGIVYSGQSITVPRALRINHTTTYRSLPRRNCFHPSMQHMLVK